MLLNNKGESMKRSFHIASVSVLVSIIGASLSLIFPVIGGVIAFVGIFGLAMVVVSTIMACFLVLLKKGIKVILSAYMAKITVLR